MHADAQALRDPGPFPPLEEGFEDDLTLQIPGRSGRPSRGQVTALAVSELRLSLREPHVYTSELNSLY